MIFFIDHLFLNGFNKFSTTHLLMSGQLVRGGGGGHQMAFVPSTTSTKGPYIVIFCNSLFNISYQANQDNYSILFKTVLVPYHGGGRRK